jgi:hypothetical protein
MTFSFDSGALGEKDRYPVREIVSQDLPLYLVHGLVVQSALPLPSRSSDALVAKPDDHSHGDRRIDVQIRPTRRLGQGDAPWGAPWGAHWGGHWDGNRDSADRATDYSLLLDTGICQIMRLSGSGGDLRAAVDTRFVMAFPHHGFRFHISNTVAGGQPQIAIDPIIEPDAPSVGAAMLDIMAFGAVLTFACRLLGLPAVHANTLLLGDQTIAFAGPSMSGKTFTSCLAIIAGAHLITDDVTVLDAQRMVHPGLVNIRLRVDEALGQCVASILADLPGLAVTQTPDERIAVSGAHLHHAPVTALTRIVLPTIDPEATRCKLVTLDPATSLMPLLHAQRLTGWVDQTWQRADFEVAAALASSVPVQRLLVPQVEPNLAAIHRVAAELRDLWS